MGFFISDSNQIRLRIGFQAYTTILRDIDEFENVPSKQQVSSFLNKIIKNFYNCAESTIAENKPIIYNKYLAWLGNIPQAEQTALKLTQKEIEERRQNIKKLYSQPPKANGQNFKLIMNKYTREILEKSQEQEIYQNSIADYLSAIIQEYAALPREKRELIFFSDIFRTMRHSIDTHHQIEITVNDKIYILKPFDILTNGFLPYYYVIGYAHIRSDSAVTEDKLLSFRLQRIQAVEEQEISCKFTNRQRSSLKYILKNPRKIGYLAGEEEEIKVMLTKRGYELYRRKILLGRPEYIQSTSLNDNKFELTFNCTQEQIYQYFIRFGKEAEIVSPQNLRERFAYIYKTAAEYYK